MKELSIEEKAKAYDKVIGRANSLLSGNQLGNAWIYKLLPELKKSEDERVRTFLHHTFTAQYLCKDKLGKWHGEPVVNILAWLEGEQKPAVFIPKFRVGDIVKSKSQPMLSPRKIISIGKDCYRCEDRGCIGFAWEDDFEIVEQNPAWSEWDEKIYNLLYEEYKNLAYYSHSREKAEDIPGEVLGWLKSLKNRVLPQPKQEWSEEDKERYISCLQRLGTGNPEQPETINSKWFKEHVYPQNRWKPSELPHWKKSTLPNDNTTGFNSDYFCHNGYCINYKELFEKLPKDD